RSRILSTSTPLSTESGAAVVPRQSAVDARVVVERVDTILLEIEHEQAVSVARRGVNGVSEQVALLVERDVANAAEQLIVPRNQIVQNHIRAMWSAGALGGGAVRAAGCSAWRTGAATRSTSPAVRRSRAGSATAQHQMARIR